MSPSWMASAEDVSRHFNGKLERCMKQSLERLKPAIGRFFTCRKSIQVDIPSDQFFVLKQCYSVCSLTVSSIPIA